MKVQHGVRERFVGLRLLRASAVLLGENYVKSISVPQRSNVTFVSFSFPHGSL